MDRDSSVLRRSLERDVRAWVVLVVFVGLPCLAAATLGAPRMDLQSWTDSHSWQGDRPGVNPVTLARQTDVPLIGWTVRGDLPMASGLHHNSMTTRDSVCRTQSHALACHGRRGSRSA